MEITDVGEVAQFLEVGIHGVDTALRLTGTFVGWTVEKALQLLKFIIARCVEVRRMPDLLKKGESRVDQLLKWNADNGFKSCVMQIDEDLADYFVEYCNENGLSYAFLKDMNKRDKCLEIVYSESQAEAFTVYIQNHRENARAFSFDKYTTNAEKEQIQKVDQAVGREVAENLKREINGDTNIKSETPKKEEQVHFDTLTKQFKHVSAVTIPLSMLSEWNQMCAVHDIQYTILRSADNDKISLAVSELDYNIVDSFLAQKKIEKENLVQFFTEHPDVELSDNMKQSARAGSNITLSDDDHFIKVDKKQIVDVNDYSVKLIVWNKEEERREYVNLPLAQIYKTNTPDKFDVLLPEKEYFKTYKQPKYKSNNEVIPQIPTKVFSGKAVAEMISHSEKYFDKQRKAAKQKSSTLSHPQPKKFVNKKKAR